MKLNQQHLFVLLCLGVFAVPASATCKYVVDNEWNNGFTASIHITNDTDTAINGWGIHWEYSNTSVITSHWSAQLTGSNPYSASALGWNRVIQPGQRVTFGMQGTKPSSAAEIPLLSGSVCEGSGAGSSSSHESSVTVSSSSKPVSSSSVSSSLSSSSRSSAFSMPASSSSSSSSVSIGAGENCVSFCRWYEDGDYSLCERLSSGWGWESNHTCIGQETCDSQSGSGGIVEACSSVSSTTPSSASSTSTISNSSSSLSTSSSSASSGEVYTGVSTHFDGLGSPYGGCGVPEATLETVHFVALNVFNTPGIYDQWPRPLSGDDLQYMGEFQNGRNCGRWVRVTMGPNCSGLNDGSRNEPFCRKDGAGWGTGWFDDQYSGATLDMIVADSCGDDNAWCRDSQYHLDFSKHSLNQFELNGSPVGSLLPNNFNNRQISWQYIEAPDYSGDIRIFFMQGAQDYWPAILITKLQNGIHAVEQWVNGEWISAERNHDMGQSFILEPSLNSPFVIRVRDVNDELINDGRQYIFNRPESCGQQCSEAVVETTYTTQ